MSRRWIARFVRPTVGRGVAVLVSVVFGAAVVGSIVYGTPAELPAVAAGWPILLHLVRAAIAAGLVGALAIAVLHLWRGDLPTELSATGAKWSAMAEPDRETHEQLLRVERESKEAIDRLTAYVESVARRVPVQPDDERAASAVERALGQWEEALSDAERKDALARAITALPEREKLVVALTYYNNLTRGEIARVLNVSEATVAAIHARAVQHLRDAVGGEPFPGHGGPS